VFFAGASSSGSELNATRGSCCFDVSSSGHFFSFRSRRHDETVKKTNKVNGNLYLICKPFSLFLVCFLFCVTTFVSTSP
jgi:hypothetical protein